MYLDVSNTIQVQYKVCILQSVLVCYILCIHVCNTVECEQVQTSHYFVVGMWLH